MIMGVDPGERRVGVAIADPETRFARPLLVIDVAEGDLVARLASLVREHDVQLVVVGKPLTLKGAEGPAAIRQRELVARLKEAAGVAVEEFDERFTTSIADDALRSAGSRRARRKEMRDAVAAQVMLQGYLDSRGPRERSG